MFDIFDQKIRKAFSESAVQYDVLAQLHREIGRELTAKLKEIEPSDVVLDIGMGTGWLTKRLKNYFPDSTVIGLDFATGMIEQARKQDSDFDIVQADARALPFKEDTMDIITSNLAYQWMDNLMQSFKCCYSHLKNGGTLCLTMFGRQTLDELFVAFEQCKGGKKSLPFRRLASRDDIKQAVMSAGFHNVSVDYEQIKVRFPDMLALIQWIKGIGANVNDKEIFIGKELLAKANDYYNGHFKDRLGIYATFEVVWVQANK